MRITCRRRKLRVKVCRLRAGGCFLRGGSRGR
nr:MAG TPA_asm: hypothetical protein [Caudoviricetes sp.]